MSPAPGGPELNPCGCCETGTTEPSISNLPGQPAIRFRVGTQPTFLRRMLADLPGQTLPDRPSDDHPLAALTTRDADDPSVALLDAWATVGDVLTFYQERIANEGYLRTATERRSVLELARAIGYELGPGVAASTVLAFTVESAPGAPGVARVPTGTKVLSVPGQDEKPQTFETIEELDARAEWNALRPQLWRTQKLGHGARHAYLAGVATQVQRGDVLLFVGDERRTYPGSERWDIRVVDTATPFPKLGYTLVTWETELGHDKPTVDPASNPAAYVFRIRAAQFGHNAPDWRAMPDTLKAAYDPDHKQHTQWPDFENTEAKDQRLDLDNVYPKVLPGSWVALSRPGYAELYRVVQAQTTARTDFTLTAQVTRLDVDAREHLSWFGLRNTTVFAQSEPLALAEEPVADSVEGDSVALEDLVDGLTAGRTVIVSGKRQRLRVAATRQTLRSADAGRSVSLSAGDLLTVLGQPKTDAAGREVWHLSDATGFDGYLMPGPDDLASVAALDDDAIVSEVAILARVSDDRVRTTVEFVKPLREVYDRSTVTINANAANATHGETTREVLGSGDGALAYQSFTLKKPPLTYVSAPTTSGSRSTLSVRVDSVLWQETPSLYGLDPRSQSYVVRLEDDGDATVTFGDGQSGARLPSGQENVVATYRSGIGPAGNVRADSLTLLQIRPLGIRGVINPMAASGAAPPEAIEDARTNAPVTVLTLGRIVSLSDFEDFARAFAGVGKARAIALWLRARHVVFVTVGADGGGPIDPSSALMTNLRAAMDSVRDPTIPLEVDSYEPVSFDVAAQVLVDPAYDEPSVLAGVKAAIVAAFSFEQRAFGQSATAAELVALIQGVAGVVATDLTKLYLTGDPAGPGQVEPAQFLESRSARVLDDGSLAPAQLLLVNPGGITLTRMGMTP